MKILTCPINGPRNITEFVWGGEVKAMPDASSSDKQWTDAAPVVHLRAGWP
jgi:sarcosine oxidase subunit delta